jgi:hypothetical protein
MNIFNVKLFHLRKISVFFSRKYVINQQNYQNFLIDTLIGIKSFYIKIHRNWFLLFIKKVNNN